MQEIRWQKQGNGLHLLVFRRYRYEFVFGVGNSVMDLAVKTARQMDYDWQQKTVCLNNTTFSHASCTLGIRTFWGAEISDTY